MSVGAVLIADSTIKYTITTSAIPTTCTFKAPSAITEMLMSVGGSVLIEDSTKMVSGLIVGMIRVKQVAAAIF